jgi:predicted alpha/beta hydrolase family esterase
MNPHTEPDTAAQAARRAEDRMRVLTLPGWQGSPAAHWQSRWERLHGMRRVEQHDWQHPRRGDWMARLDEALLEEPGPALLVAHSLGCQLVASWAAHSRHTATVQGALLVAPPDTERPDMPPQLHTWRPFARARLPFRATVVASSDDPYCTLERSAEMARDWGASLVLAGPRGHLNADSNLGDWSDGHSLFLALRSD